MENKTTFTPYDEAMQTRKLQMLKTMVPYLANNMQKQAALLIQIIECKNAMSIFSADNNSLAACEIPEGSNRTTALLGELKQYCTPKERDTIDTLLNLFCIMDNYELFMQ